MPPLITGYNSALGEEIGDQLKALLVPPTICPRSVAIRPSPVRHCKARPAWTLRWCGAL